MLSLRRKGETIAPVLAPVDDEHLALARDVVALFEAHVGRRRRELLDALAERERQMGPRFKVVRGLATLLERRAAFEMATRLDPSRARRAIHDACARLQGGAATTLEARERVLAEAARDVAVTVDELERAATADADANLVLVAFTPVDPERLLLRHNVALVQTLLFDATRVEVEIESGVRDLLGLVKLNGLMHVVERRDDGWHRVVLDGPLSILRDTRRYGTAMAKVLPGLARCGRWRLEAHVHEAETGKTRVFRTDHERLPIPSLHVDEPDAAVGFDSALERRFSEAWRALRTPWRLVREPAAIQLRESDEVVIPDFGFSWRDGPVVAYLEIAGFWTPDYLARKLERMRRLPSGTPLLLAIDDALALGEAATAGVEVVRFEDDLDPMRVLSWLREREEALHERDAGSVSIPRDAPVVDLARLARERGVSLDAVERALTRDGAGARERVANTLVAPAVLAEADAKLSEGMPVAEAEAALRAFGLDDASSVLARLGWSAQWRGLDASAATLRRRAP